jgi:hypothetical protein
MKYTLEPLDLTERYCTMFFFWLPHLARHIDLPSLAAERPVRYSAAQTLKAVIRRRVVQLYQLRFQYLPSSELWYALKYREVHCHLAKFPDYTGNNGDHGKYGQILIAGKEYMERMRDVIPVV